MNLRSNEICKLTKSAYGLVNAPYLSYQALRKKLLEIGFEESAFDPCVYLLRDPKTGEPEGILGAHVDGRLGRFDAQDCRAGGYISFLAAVVPGNSHSAELTFNNMLTRALPCPSPHM